MRSLLTTLIISGRLVVVVLSINERVRPLLPYIRPVYAYRRELGEFMREFRRLNAVLQHDR